MDKKRYKRIAVLMNKKKQKEWCVHEGVIKVYIGQYFLAKEISGANLTEVNTI